MNVSPVLTTLMGKLGAATGAFSFTRWKELEDKDPDIVRQVAKVGGILVGPDRRQQGESLVAEAVHETQARIVWLPSEFANSRQWDQAWWMLTHWLEVAVAVAELQPGECCYVELTGRVVRVVPGALQNPRRRKVRSQRLATIRGPFYRHITNSK